MFQGLLIIEGIWVQHRVSPEPFKLSQNVANIYDFYLNYNTKDSQFNFGGHFGIHIENMKNAYKQLFVQNLEKTSIYIKYQILGFILIYCFILNKNQNIAVEVLNASCMSPP